MDIKGNHRFQAPRKKVWEALLDPQTLAHALPGGEELKEVGENQYNAAMNVRVGPVQGKFTGKIELSNIEPPQSYTMEVDGSGTAGFVRGKGTLNLEEQGEETLLEYAGDVQIGGRIASVGQRLVESTAKSLIRQGLTALDAHLQAPVPSPAPQFEAAQSSPANQPAQQEQSSADTSVRPEAAARSQSSPVASGPSAMSVATEVAKDVVRDVASDYVTPAQQDKILYALFGAGLMLLFVILVRLVQRG